MSLVRPDEIEEFSDMGDEERQEPAHQEEAYRKAWEPFDPNEEEQDQGDKNREGPPESREREEAGEGIQDEEGMTSKGLKVPRGPTQKEVEEHSMTHWPFRDWCAHCVRGKAKSIGHRRKRSEHEVPIITIDYMWMTGEGDKEGQPGRLRGMPILVAVDDATEWMGAWVVPEKGEHWYAIKVLITFVEELGYESIILKSDQEPAIMGLKAAVKREMSTRVVFEESPVGESQSLGGINVQIQVIQGQVRTLRDALEARYQQRMMGDSTLIPWMIQHAVGVLNRYRMGGKSGRKNTIPSSKGEEGQPGSGRIRRMHLVPEAEVGRQVQGARSMGRRSMARH